MWRDQRLDPFALVPVGRLVNTGILLKDEGWLFKMPRINWKSFKLFIHVSRTSPPKNNSPNNLENGCFFKLIGFLWGKN